MLLLCIQCNTVIVKSHVLPSTVHLQIVPDRRKHSLMCVYGTIISSNTISKTICKQVLHTSAIRHAHVQLLDAIFGGIIDHFSAVCSPDFIRNT